MLSAQAALDQAKINLGYTEIRAPIDGRIGMAAVSVGNFVSPTSGTLATIVSQDPIHVLFPVSTRQIFDDKQTWLNVLTPSQTPSPASSYRTANTIRMAA